MQRKISMGIILAAAFIAPASASAAKPVSPPPSCTVVTFDVVTLNCVGFFSGNLIAEDGPKLTQALSDIGALDSSATALIEKIEWTDGMDPYTLSFDTPLFGQSVIGIHFGGGNTGFNGTAFWLLDVPFATNTLSYSSNVQKGISNAGLYSTQTPAVPEPAAWSLMLIGFGAVGFGMRRSQSAKRRKMRVRFAI